MPLATARHRWRARWQKSITALTPHGTAVGWPGAQQYPTIPQRPSNVRMVLASTSATSTLQELAIMADEIIEVSVPPPSPPIINKVSSTDLASELAQLRHKVVQLKLTLQMSARSLSRTHSPSWRTQRSPDRQSSNCWYHPLLGLHALSSPQHYNTLFPQPFTRDGVKYFSKYLS